jgi:outer membrane protein assembly complex protein YaeT
LNKSFLFCISIVLIGIGLTGLNPAVNIANAVLSDQQTGSTEQIAQQVKPYNIAIIGNTHFSASDLLNEAADELQMFDQRGFRKADIDDAAFQMRSKYLQAGFAFAFVEYRYKQTDNFFQVTFEVEEGPQVFIEQIDFVGNNNISTDKLAGFFPQESSRWGQQQSLVFVDSVIKEATARIRDYYQGEGFNDVNVEVLDLAFTEDRTGVSITIQIDEGPQFFIHDIVLSGDLLTELESELEKIKKDFIGQTFYVRQKLIFRTRLEQTYDAIGYADAVFVTELVYQEEPGSVIIKAHVNKGAMATIGKIVIAGNKRTREDFIRARVQFKTGDMYTNTMRRESFRKLFDSGLFARITIELQEANEDSSHDLVVTVDELPTREVFIEPGWGSYERLRLRAGVFKRNLFGIGKSGRIEGVVSTKGETITVSYTDPWLLRTDIKMNVPVFYERREEPSYTSEEKGFSAMFSKRLSRRLTLSTGYQYKRTGLFDLTEDAPLPLGEEDYNKGTVGVQATWDTRNDIFYPSAGLRLASSFDISLPALGSELEFGRITLGCRYFFKLPREFILGLRATTGLMIPFGDQTTMPISERFFNGGDTTVRSYKHSELGPKDSNNEPLGGLGYNVFSIELRKRFYKNSAVTLYVDAGNVSPNRSLFEEDFKPYISSSDLLDDTLNDFFSEFKYGIGVGYQYLLPVGPIRFDLAYNPDPEEIWDEDAWVFHFSLGMAF